MSGKLTKQKTVNSKQRHVLCFDPGKAHFAYCDVVGTDIKSVGMVTETIDDLKTGIFPYRLRMFYRQLKKLVATSESKYGTITDIVCERFMARPGKGGGAVSESINVMLGVIALFCHKNNIHIELVSSSQWKNRMKRRLGGDTQAQRYGYSWMSKEPLKGNPYPISDHEFDATGIALAYIETAPALGAGTRTKQNLDHFASFKQQLRKLWDKRAKEIGYDESKDIAREAKARKRKADKEQSSDNSVSKTKTGKTKARSGSTGLGSAKPKKNSGKRKGSR